MELTRNHRQSLLDRFTTNTQRIETSKACERNANPEHNMAEYYDIDIFLLQKQQELIEQSLIENEIDY